MAASVSRLPRKRLVWAATVRLAAVFPLAQPYPSQLLPRRLLSLRFVLVLLGATLGSTRAAATFPGDSRLALRHGGLSLALRQRFLQLPR